MGNYTIEDLEHLRNVRSLGFDNWFQDDIYVTDKSNFNSQTEIFIEWLKKMESNNKIEELLRSKPN